VTYAIGFAIFFRRVGRMDHDQLLVFYELQFWNTRLFGPARQWSPLLCSGLSLAADTQVPFLSPGVALSFLLGPFYGLRAATLAWFGIGWLGAFAYAGLCRRETVVRALAASLFVGNGFFLMRLHQGHLGMLPMLSLPLVLWVLHRRRAIAQVLGGALVGGLSLVLLLGGLVALAIDGAPTMIVHWLFWVGLYALTLAFLQRRPAVLVLLASAVGLASLLDAGYLWPMLAGQQEFPRITADTFTHPLALLWFLVVPGGVELVPAPARGHELTVWVGPVVLYAIVRHGRSFARGLGRDLRVPLAVTAAASLVLGMGSLALLGWPRLLSPFDLLRPLPGFRSMGVTARYWGFLALPLALAGAAGLAELLRARRPSGRVQAALAFGIALQVGFQAAVFISAFEESRTYAPAPIVFDGAVDYAIRGHGPQGALITPTRGLIDCYDNGDFLHPALRLGHQLVQRVTLDGEPFPPTAFTARFLTWSSIALEPTRALPAGAWQVVLVQAYHRFWRLADAAQVVPSSSGNLEVRWRAGDTPGRVKLEFEDRVSTIAARVSLLAWAAVLIALPLIVCLGRLCRRE
jgi:hypothetical protein